MNPVPVDAAPEWLFAVGTTLLDDVAADEFQHMITRRSREWRPDRVWGYRDDGRWVGTLATDARVLTVPGPSGTTREMGVDALTAVSVAATHRRRGLLTSMISASLQAAKDRGDPLSILVAAEWPIYGRFGYAPAVHVGQFTYHSRRPNATLPGTPTGRLRQADPDEIGKAAREVFDAARRLRPGHVDRPGEWWDRRLGLDGLPPIGKQHHWILREGPDGPDGLLAWRMDRDFDLSGRLAGVRVPELFAANDAAYRDLWGYLGGMDVIEEIKFINRPLDEPVRWLLPDARALELTGTFDHLWIRLLDVPAALTARSYALPGRVVLDVADTGLGGYGNGRFLLEAGDDGSAACTPTTQPADLVVTQRALAACYVGGYRLRQLAIDGVEERTPGALDRADLMFSTPVLPWNPTGF